MISCRTETETVSRMQKAWPFDCCCCRCLSACFRTHSRHFEHILWCFHNSMC